ncbi:MAG: tetratricopeptide repeat protein [Gammaproteobacteria bacterium]|nr:tetratricopeptide repeat protein [Gammaproteobacteria bacterium]
MTSGCRNLLLAAVLSIACIPQAMAAVDKKDTIKSLERKTFEVRPGRLIVNSTDKARDNYRAFLDLVSDDPELRAEAMRRLGDLELDASEAEQLSQNIEAMGSAAYESAVSLFHQLLETYPDYRRNDTVLYQLARAYEIAGETDDALRVLNELIDRYPATELLDEVQFRRGEMLFLRKRYDESELAYSDVVGVGEISRFYEQSLYKLGWSRFKLASHEDSLDPFFSLLDRKLASIELRDGDERLAELSRANRELVEDTFRVLSISFSYMDGADSIISYFDHRGFPEYGYLIFQNLGDLYLEKERFVDAAESYEAFSRLDPDHPKSPLLQVEVIEAYKLGGFPTLVLEAKKGFVERYGMDRPFWLKNSAEKNTAVAAYLKANLNDLAQYYHAEAQSKDSRSDYQEAALWYRKYLDYFPGDPDSAKTNFLLGEILFESDDFYQATLEYERTAYEYPLHEQSSEAAYAAILSYREYEKTLQGTARTAWHQQYLDSGLRFADTYPQHPESGAVLTTIAEDLFAQAHYDLAIAVGQTVVAKQPAVADPLARTAWTVIAHSQFELQNFAEGEAAYYQLRSYTPADDTVAQQEIKDRIASSIYKQGEQARDLGDLESAVTHFTRLGKVVPDADIRATAEYDAAAALISMASWGRATSVLEDFRRDYPDSEFADDITAKLAVSYLESGRGTEAAAEFERIAVDSDSEEIRREALWKAAGLYKDGNQVANEKRVLDNIITRYPKPIAESIEARYRLLQIAEASGDNVARTARLKDMVQVDATAGAQRSDRTRYLAAKASLELAEPARRSFMAMKISQPLADSMKLKKRLMEDVLAAYGTAAEYGVAEVTTAATFRLAEAYKQMAADLMDSERPADLDAETLEQYDLLLEEQVYPFEEKAIDLFKVNTDRAAEGVYDKWVKYSFDEMAILMPARYAKLERSEDVVTAIY